MFPVHTIVACWPTRTEIDDGPTDIDGDIESYGKINRYNKLGVQKSVLHVFTYETNQKIVPDLENAMDGFEHTQCQYMGRNEIDNLYMSNGIKEILLNFL